MKQKVLAIVGPTASGKSALAVSLAQRCGGEVISADSRQVYKSLDIGTGKVTKKEMCGVPHHLLDVASPKRAFSAGAFEKRATKVLKEMGSRGTLPIIAGGTGFYIDTLLGRITLPSVASDAALRKRLSGKSAAQLYMVLKQLDPKRACALSSPSERNNKVRLIRAIEVARMLGKSPKAKACDSHDVLWIGIVPSDSELRKRINKRLRERLKGGMLAEAKRLHKAGVSYKRMEELGLEYRSLARHLKGEISREEMERELQSAIWRYARKQLGYWKRNKLIRWFRPTDKKRIETSIRQWLKK